MEKFIVRVLRTRKGSTKAVATSGMSCMSDSAMPAKPRIEEPSKSWPVTKKSSSTLEAGTLKWCCMPGRSVKRMSTNSIPSSLMYARTSAGEVNMVRSCGRDDGGMSGTAALAWRVSSPYLPGGLRGRR